MKRIPMLLQLALILFCVMAIPLSILTWYSGAQILRNSELEIAESALAGLNANRKLNENALNNLAQDAVRLSSTHIYDRIRNFETYAELGENYGNMSSALTVLNELVNLNHRVDGVYSTYFYLEGANYVISTDKGITTLDRYESIDWIERALIGRVGIGGIWVPRELSSGTSVISYVLPLNRLSTTTRGMIVVNLRESQIESYLRSSEPGEHGFVLMRRDGTIISHDDKSLLLTNGRELPFVGEILDQGIKQGYAFHELDDKRLLYTWSFSERYRWWNVSILSMDELMTQTRAMQRSILLLTVVIFFVGTLLSVLLATWLSKPVRRLVHSVRARGNLGISGRNELAFLDAAFRRMQEEEEGLHLLLRQRERDTRSLAIHNLLKGEVSEQAESMFPEPYCLITIVSIDQYRNYVRQANSETRSYHRYLFNAQCEDLFPEDIHAYSVYQGEGYFAMVINYGEGEAGRNCEGIHGALAAVRTTAEDIFGHTVTIGVSSPAALNGNIPDRAAEAMEMIKYRMIEGGRGIIFWRGAADNGSRKYVYPSLSERRILNFLNTGDLDSIHKELSMIRQEILSAEYISYDNIMFIYNQLLSVTIKHLRENNISTERIFAGRGNVYSAIASLDTLDELEEYMRGFFGEIIQYLTRNQGEAGHGERIVRYLEQHYCEEIVFENMAKEIGISYSYMRRIVYELTGKSLIDYINQLRIEKAKQLLLETSLTIAQIASEVGYYNVQSFNRFFRKYEGMAPSSYRSAKTNTS
ncbi:AraC family transcriptional regulator [Paenibacillus brevis]|uniref:Helix-turn-helix domain-containing protein n=1 Tax=Paenibacillus brevis TaxID=2841508 RepID=A0ABS6FPD6_9BACL|nr:helix-turn-helix domain-containing protein [Paenibacillus brevis]MBU5671323.1 helix-turn-helix domain-containing protein [Paenibacillus brevis]